MGQLGSMYVFSLGGVMQLTKSRVALELSFFVGVCWLLMVTCVNVMEVA